MLEGRRLWDSRGALADGSVAKTPAKPHPREPRESPKALESRQFRIRTVSYRQSASPDESPTDMLCLPHAKTQTKSTLAQLCGIRDTCLSKVLATPRPPKHLTTRFYECFWFPTNMLYYIIWSYIIYSMLYTLLRYIVRHYAKLL